jgi:RNA ligase (TIGR02306 family)
MYERNVGHCVKTTHVKEVTIKSIEPAFNSDNLEIVKFNEVAWQVLSQKDLHEIGEKVTYIPPECVLPFELSEELQVTSYLSKGRVKAIMLRGNRSEGLIADTNKVKPYLDFILQWEDPPTIAFSGSPMRNADVPQDFQRFYKMPNLLNEPDIFSEKDVVLISEKIHGTNVRFGMLRHPETNEYQLYVGSHNVTLKETDDNTYWRVVRRFVPDENAMPNDVIFYGEIYGLGIQKMAYNEPEPTLKIFAAMLHGEYLAHNLVISECKKLNLPVVNYYGAEFISVDHMRDYAEQNSEHYNGFREGIVITKATEPSIMAKLKSFQYLERFTK